jgi:1-deoxy-D-xylulose-5-phosphate reductoisomerase
MTTKSFMKRIAILGSTGSIGASTLSVVETYPQRFSIVSLAAGRNVDAAFEQAVRWRPRVISVAAQHDAEALKSRLRSAGVADVEVVHGPSATIRVATHPEADFVVSAIVGVAGWRPRTKQCALARQLGWRTRNAGRRRRIDHRRGSPPGQAAACRSTASTTPSISACAAGKMDEVERIWLTASGGPFLNTPKSQFSSITVEQALNHPTWKMGRRITIDSATLMNKGFEVIEACRLFNMPPSQVEGDGAPAIHNSFHGGVCGWQHTCSILGDRHAIADSLRADLSGAHPSDMRFPVKDLRHLDFCPPDFEKFPCLRLAYEAAEAGGAKTVALNAADEVAVAAFLEGLIGFNEIPKLSKTCFLQRKARSWNLC